MSLIFKLLQRLFFQMSSLRFPTIQTKKSLMQEQDYNFVNKEKKKKMSSNNPLELIEELKRKIDEQKKEIQNRNMTIQGLQRNFESLSVIVKNQKAQSASLRAELQHLKQNSQSGDRRASEYHERCLSLEKEVKSLKQQLKITKKAHSQCDKYVTLTEQFKKRIIQLQEINQKLHSKLMQSDVDKKVLENELNKYKLLQKDKRLLNQRIVDLEDQVKKLTDKNNGLNYRQATSEEEHGRLRNELAFKDKKIEEIKMRLRDAEKQRERVEFDNDFLKKEVASLTEKIQQNESLLSNKDLYSKIKMQQQQKLKQEYKKLLHQYHQLQQSFKKISSESQQKTEMLNFAHNEIESMKKDQKELKLEFAAIESDYQKQVQKLTKSIKQLHQQLNLSTGESSELSKKLVEQQQQNSNYNDKITNLHDNIDEMNRKMQEHQEKYGHYLKLIAKNQPDVVITNKRTMNSMENGAASTISKLQGDIQLLEKTITEMESTALVQNNNVDNMKKYIKSLEEEVSTKSEELLEKTRLLRKFEEQEEQLNRMISNERKLSEKQKIEAEAMILQRMRQLENEKLKSQKQKQEQRKKLQEQLIQERRLGEQNLKRQRQQSQKYSKLLQNYKQQEQKLKQMMSKQQHDLTRLQLEKEQQIKNMIKEKEEQLQKEKKNNKLLWSDNKKLKDLQNKLKEQSKMMLDEKEAVKREQIQRLKKQLQKKYKEEMNSIKSQESNSHELKRILNQRNKQYKDLSQSHNKLKGQSEFYKNRNKELQGLVTRMEKQFKEKTSDLQRETKSQKQVIQVLEKKLKDAEANLNQSQKKQKRELKYLYDQIEEMKQTAKSQRVEEKVALVNKSMGDLDTSLKTLMNTMSCNYCVEVVKDCIRLECGHIYCKKCKGGYDPNCGQCKKKSTAIPDKMIDDSVSKAQYMRILINTIKDDLSKISQ